MANTRSAIKRMRQTKRRTEINRRNKTRLRSQVKKLHKAIQGEDLNAAQGSVPLTYSVVDRAVKKGIIKKNKASRIKSRLTLHLNKVQAAQAPAKS